MELLIKTDAIDIEVTESSASVMGDNGDCWSNLKDMKPEAVQQITTLVEQIKVIGGKLSQLILEASDPVCSLT